LIFVITKSECVCYSLIDRDREVEIYISALIQEH